MSAKSRFRKRLRVGAIRPTRSEELARIAEEIDRGDYAKALADLNKKLAITSAEPEKGILLCQVGRSLYKRGLFSDAAHVYHKAAGLTQVTPRDWLKPLLAEILALVKNVSLSDAREAADRCYSMALAKSNEFAERRAGADKEFATKGRIVIPLKPHRPCVVATELGELFFREGELDSAQYFFEIAIAGNPKGGTRARQGLAEIALRNDDPETAFQRSVEAITFGKFQAKTIASWKPYFAAKRKMSQSGLPPEFLANLRASYPSVRARAVLMICHELRSGNDSQWKTLANTWLRSESEAFPAVAAELRKMLMADTKISAENPPAQIAAAQALLSTARLAPHEWLAGAKERVRASLFANRNPGISSLVAEGTKLYGSRFAHQLQHSLALSCMMARRHDLARPILHEVIAQTSTLRNHIWSKATWALGRMETLLKQHQAAADAFASIADEPRVPTRFRLQARMFWAENLLATGNVAAVEECAETLPSLLADIDDFEVLLDFARQLSRSDGDFGQIVSKIYSMGESKALKAFEEATHPSQALNVLFKLTRRQVYDFGHSNAVVDFWKNLQEQKRLWLWNNDNQWWGYLAFVLMAYSRTDRLSEAATLAQLTLEDPATPREALPIILLPYYEELIDKGRSMEALEAFRWIVTESPSKAGCANAYYWLALDAYRQGLPELMKEYVSHLQLSNAHTQVELDKWYLEASAHLLLGNMDLNALPTQAVKFDDIFIQRTLARVKSHLMTLSGE